MNYILESECRATGNPSTATCAHINSMYKFECKATTYPGELYM